MSLKKNSKKNELKKKNYVIVIFSVISLAMMLIASYELKWLDVIIAICKLEFSNSNVEKISFKSNFYITKVQGEKFFFDEMEKLQFKYVDKFGKGYIFTDGKEEKVVLCSKHLNKYLLYEIAK